MRQKVSPKLSDLRIPPTAVRCLAAAMRLSELGDEVEAIVEGVHLEGTFADNPREPFDDLASAMWSAAFNHMHGYQERAEERRRKVAAQPSAR